MMRELRPCPFCGSNAAVLEHERLNGPALYKIVCSSKKCRGHDSAGNIGAWLENGWRESREIATQIWNRRAERTCRMDNSQCPSCSIKTGVEHERFWRVEVDEVDYFLVDRDALLALADEIEADADDIERDIFHPQDEGEAAGYRECARRIRAALGVDHV